MAKNGYDQTYEDDRKENEETKDLPRRAAKAAIDLVKPKETKPDTGETTNIMGDKYKKGGKVKKTGKALVHKNEVVLPVGVVKSLKKLMM